MMLLLGAEILDGDGLVTGLKYFYFPKHKIMTFTDYNILSPSNTLMSMTGLTVGIARVTRLLYRGIEDINLWSSLY